MENTSSPIKDVDLSGFADWQGCALFLKSFLPAFSVAEITDYCGRVGFLPTKPAQKKERSQKSVKNFLSKNKEKTCALTGWDPAGILAPVDEDCGGQFLDITKLAFTQMQCRFVKEHLSSTEVIRDVCFAGIVCGVDSLDFLKRHWTMWKHERDVMDSVQNREWPEWCDSVMESCLNVAKTMRNGDAVDFLEREKKTMKLDDVGGSNKDLKPFLAERAVKPDLVAYCRGVRDLFEALDMPAFNGAKRKKDADHIFLLQHGLPDSFVDEVVGFTSSSAAGVKRPKAEEQISVPKKRLLAAALNHFLLSLRLVLPEMSTLGVEAMTKCMDILAMMRKSDKIEAVLALFKDRCERSNSLLRPYMLRKVLLDLAVFHHGCYRLADAKSCLELASASMASEDDERQKVRLRMLEARLRIDLGDFERALQILEPLSKMHWGELAVATRGKLGCWGSGASIDPLEENKNTRFNMLRTELLLLKIFTLSDMGLTKDAEQIVANDLRSIPIGHRQLAMPIAIPNGYRGPLDREALHRFTKEQNSAAGGPILTQDEMVERVRELDQAGNQRVKMDTGVTEEEVEILQMWIRMRDVKNDARTVDDVSEKFRTRYSSVAKIAKIFEKSFLKMRRYKKLWAEIMGVDARRRNEQEDALRFYGIILQDEWCHVTAYNLLSVARSISESKAQEVVDKLR